MWATNQLQQSAWSTAPQMFLRRSACCTSCPCHTQALCLLHAIQSMTETVSTHLMHATACHCSCSAAQQFLTTACVPDVSRCCCGCHNQCYCPSANSAATTRPTPPHDPQALPAATAAAAAHPYAILQHCVHADQHIVLNGAALQHCSVAHRHAAADLGAAAAGAQGAD